MVWPLPHSSANSVAVETIPVRSSLLTDDASLPIGSACDIGGESVVSDNKIEKHGTGRRVRSRTISCCALVASLILSPVQQAKAAPEDILAGAFDKITGVPFASTMLAIVRQGESSPQSPAALDARLSAVEALLRNMEPRLRLVEERLKQHRVKWSKSRT
jgi:hypothetical protein